MIKAASLLVFSYKVLGHGYLTQPLPRQYREEGLAGVGWTNWMGITVPGDESFNPGEGNAPNLNAGIGGGVAGMDRELSEGHGLCGDIGTRKAFTDGPYGATASRGTYAAGGTLDVSVKLTAYHAGWFEFRLCNVDATGSLTQECLNEHVLEIDDSTPYYPAVLDYTNMKGISQNGDGGWYKCATTAGYTDPTSNTPQQVWPHGSCCNGGGACSDPTVNKDRYIVEFAGDGGVREYDIVLKLPDIECSHCVLQWFYQTANSRETYPESFWNCADIAVTGGNSNPTTGAVTTVSPVTTPTTSTVMMTTTTTDPASSSSGDCKDIYNDCQPHWCTNEYWFSQCLATCDACGGSTATDNPTTTASSTTTTAAPIVTTTAASTATTTTASSSGDCKDIYNDCQPHWCSTSEYWFSQCLATCGACGGSTGTDNPTTTASATTNPTATTTSTTTTPSISTTSIVTATTNAPSTGGNAAGWERVMSPELIAKGHPWGISNFGPNGLTGLAAAQVIYEDIKTALEAGPPQFAAFCNSGNDEQDKREAAAFLANVLKETGGYSDFIEVSPHGTYCTWNGEGGSDLQAAGEPFPCGAPWAAEGYANEFIGRGAIQLTWNINYGRFSDFYFGDQDVLLKNPELVEGDGPLGWAASLWFWMTPQDFGGQCPPQQLDSNMPLGHMSCHQAMGQGGGGMGQTIRIINGGYESCPTSSYRTSALYRLEYFLGFTSLMSVPPADNALCTAGTDVSRCDLSGMDRYQHTQGTIGNPLIGSMPSDDCPNCQIAQCSATMVTKWLLPGQVQKYEWDCV